MKKESLILLLCLTFLSSCGDVSNTNDSVFNMSFNDSNVVFTATNCDSFEVYKKEINKNEFVYLESSNGTEYKTNDIYSDFYFVPIKNNKVLKEKKSETFNYYQGIFNSNNVKVFSPYNSSSSIQKYISEKYDVLIKNEFSDERVAMLFMPGIYEDVTLNIGYYTSVNGLGYSPLDVSIKKLQTSNNPNSKNALINFWRTAENLTFNESSLWAVSQATSLRRIYFKNHLTLSDSDPTGNNFSSGGFISDSVINGTIYAGSQQQWLMRNSTFNNWTNSNMNMVFVGSSGNTPTGEWYSNRTTLIEKTPLVQEKPYIVFDEEKGYGIVVPDKRVDSNGISWKKNNEINSTFVSLNDFYIAHSDIDTSLSLNSALNNNKHILFTPGTYNLDEPLKVTKDDTILYGLGLTTLNISDDNNETAMIIESEKGVKLSGIIFQAGKKSNTLLKVGLEKNDNDNSDNPICFNDVFFRVGGHTTEKTSVDNCLELNTNDVLADNFWIWRADHGVKDIYNVSSGIGWNKNHAKNGIIVNGDDFTVYGLMVEHFCEYQTIWNGENGRMYFYQSETPYDALNQESWNNNLFDDPINQGYASYKISSTVQNHEAYGLGIYFVNTISVEKFLHHAIECPENNIKIYHASARYFGGDGCILNVINNIKGQEDNYKNLTLEAYECGKYY